MKFAITWFDGFNDGEGRFEGQKSFILEGRDVDPNDSGELPESLVKLMDNISKITDAYEARGITIDHGGDDDWYELDLPDWDSGDLDNWNQIAFYLLSDVEALVS
jgi:hypothetical protein